ncbi:hypothetical protein CEQ90_06315 [Lewinellaceae bacterium SD302]|nr:hypothetical protein CEQ90_06315 [Lewinellaceae bacterium SD302]
MIKKLTIFLLLLLLAGAQSLVAQSTTAAEESALRELKVNFAEHGLSSTDVAELRVDNSYVSGEVTHVYVQQFFEGVAVQNALAGLHFDRTGELRFQTNNFVADLENRLPGAVSPSVSAQDAVMAAVASLNINAAGQPVRLTQQGNKLVFSWASASANHLTAQLLIGRLNADRELRLVWQIFVEQRNTADLWLVQVDAATGLPVQRFNQTVYCSFDVPEAGAEKVAHRHGRDCFGELPALNPNLPVHESLLETVITDGSVYNVFPFGIDAPNAAGRELISEPADLEASPFGWHDVDGEEGADFTITRGNNVSAYADRNADNAPDTGLDVDGGEELEFDFFYEDNGSLSQLLPAAVTQLFYMNNMLHDFTWHHGFDAASGNFQQNNYDMGGLGGDPVNAEAQDGSGTNNANFGTPPDGSSGRMQMFIWTNGGTGGAVITEPSDLAGSYPVGTAAFGPAAGFSDLTGEIALAYDGTNDSLLTCEAVANPDEVNGHIALILRGGCTFEQKTLNAEAAGAIGAIICNPENQLITMGAGVDGQDPDIPAIMLRESDCIEIRAALADGEKVIIRFPELQGIDGDFDNGIVAHELGHGISNRLVGGPGNTSCLTNQEQMGEGWSDFFALASSPLNGATGIPTGGEPRGIGTFALGQGPNGSGIRRQPYSNNMFVNDFTYDDVITSGTPHPLGEIWATTLWDMYWALVDVHGFDEDLINGELGNNIAVRLVIEGLKQTKCNPGMVDGRDGILAADMLIYGGANQCTIWEAFARRGLGFSADQGSGLDKNDGEEAFDLPPSCIPTVKVIKETSVTTVELGESFNVRLTVRNDKDEAVTDVVVTDEIPASLIVLESSVEGVSDFTLTDSELSFTIPELLPGEEELLQVTYSAETSIDHSVRLLFDGGENGDDAWTTETLNNQGNAQWELSQGTDFEGNFAWFVPNVEAANDQVLYLTEPLSLEGEAPGVRFYTLYNSEAVFDGGIMEISINNGQSWANVGNERLIRGKYRGEVQASAFSSGVFDRDAYWGRTAQWREVLVDLSEFAGLDVLMRWRFGSDNGGAADPGFPTPGWYIDNIELMDVFRYNGKATVTTAEGDFNEGFGQEGGVLVDTDISSDLNETVSGISQMSVYPNPAGDFINVSMSSQFSEAASVQLMSVEGRVIARKSLSLVNGTNSTVFNTSNLAAGVYLVQVVAADRTYTEKVTIK